MSECRRAETRSERPERETSARGPAWKTGVAVVLTLTLWASAFVGIRAGLRSYSPGALALLRYLVASLVLAGVVAVGRHAWPPRRAWPRLVVAGAIGIALYNLALNTGERTVTAGAASFLGNSAPVSSAILAAAGYVLWGYALARMPVARTTSFLYFVPALAMAIGWIWLGEMPAPLSIAGGMVALAGVLAVNRFGRTPARNESDPPLPPGQPAGAGAP